MCFCRAGGTQNPPCAVRSLNASCSGSPAVQMRPGPLGSFVDARNPRNSPPALALNLSNPMRGSMSIAINT